MGKYISALCVFIILLGCKSRNNGIMNLEHILKLNPELYQVLEKYKDDSLKYDAALFLIENLPYHRGQSIQT